MKKYTVLTYLSIALLFSHQTFAETNSTGSLKNQWQQTEALAQLKQVTEESSQTIKTGQTREQVIALNQQQPSYKNKMLMLNQTQKQQSTSLYHNEFNIYQGYVQLIEDYDQDGFFQTFSVTFDADVYSHDIIDEAYVYAELYLSKNGGDWVHYYTTDNFMIYGESEDDQYEVYTTLNQGYISDHYDVLIDLYEVGYGDVVATYSSNDTNDLYALPLESSDYDPNYVEYHSESHSHGGSFSLIITIMLGLVALTRKRRIG
ncbi:choice-of-anchor H family protein [Thalassotalea sp. G2M2-11]|uniref:choice-of-anchor H family protein n=1 Tax=Thalassotalea sp. G2M2-11 TaxID=2787627 RepID=UPI0019D236BF|nr:choice-of-anchor H family protein [Thalassotalea sp. G2M2-11]